MTGVDQLAQPGNTSVSDAFNSFNSSFDEDMGPSAFSGPSAAQSSRRAKNAGINRPHTVGELDWYEDVSTPSVCVLIASYLS